METLGDELRSLTQEAEFLVQQAWESSPPGVGRNRS